MDQELDGQMIEGSWRREIGGIDSFLPLTRFGRKSSKNAEDIRKEFAEYFTNNRRVPWQETYE